MYLLTVILDVDPKHIEEFKAAALAQARNTRANEKGCLAFSVFQSEERPDRFHFHEVYENKSALDDVHNHTPYLAAFRAAVASWVVGRSAERWNLVEG